MELLVVVTILAIVAGIGFPSLAEYYRARELTTQTNRIVSSLQLARSEAMSRGRPVLVCASNFDSTPADCNDGNWTNGWLVAADADSDGQVNQASDILRAVTDDTGLSGYSSDPARVRFTADGLIESNSERFIRLKRADCDTGQPGARKVGISKTGRVEVERINC